MMRPSVTVKTLVAVHNVTDPTPVIEVFDDHKAEYNPDGSRNLRDDVAGMTVGAVAGAVAGGVAGTAIAGPLLVLPLVPPQAP